MPADRELRKIGPLCIFEDKMISYSSRFISFISRYWYPVAASAE
jgi:hypothetical protein